MNEHVNEQAIIVPPQKKKQRKIWLVIVLLAVLAYVLLAVRLPYYVELPGGMGSVAEVLTVDGEADEAEGSYNYTYVSIAKATPALLIYAWLTPYTDIHSEQATTGGFSDEDYERINRCDLETSQNMAKYQGLLLAGEEVELSYFGVYVLGIAENSTFKDILRVTDTVTGVNGKTFQSSSELIDYVSGLKLGSKVSVTFQSDGKSYTKDGKIIKLENGKNGIGITLTDHTEVKTSHQLDFYTENLGGPSAGLMFTLGIYTQLENPDLRQGRTIAGTGTVEEDGTVGMVGGVDKKVVAAAESGADVFFAPDQPVDKALKKKDPNLKNNYDEAVATAKAIKTDMKIVPVKTVQDAIDYLQKGD